MRHSAPECGIWSTPAPAAAASEQAAGLSISHISQRGISGSHQQASLPVDYLEQSRCGGGGLSFLGGEQIFEGFGIQSLDPKIFEGSIQGNLRQLQQQEVLNISHISHRGISGSHHQASLLG